MESPIALTLALIAISTLLVACGADDTSQASTGSDRNELGTFLSLHKQYCESTHKTRDSLEKALQADKRFQPAVGFNGVYEAKIAGVSYAVSPELDGCTTDVLVQDASTGKLLFSYDEINAALVKNGYSVVGDETQRKDIGRDEQEVTILEKSFVSPMNELTNLDYPADRKDQYYMTLFAKKFEALEITEELSLNN